MPADGQTFIAATGGAINAGQSIVLTLSGLPHHSGMPRRIALLLAIGIAIVGVLALSKPAPAAVSEPGERKRLLARREKLLNELVKLEAERRSGRVDDRRYSTRREELIAPLEHVYGALDNDEHVSSSATAPHLAAPARALGAS
jgi:hypothetical protein